MSSIGFCEFLNHRAAKAQRFTEGSVEEKIEAAEAIWNSIDESLIPVTDEETRIVKDCYEQYLQNPNDTIDWESAKQKLMAKYGL